MLVLYYVILICFCVANFTIILINYHIFIIVLSTFCLCFGGIFYFFRNLAIKLLILLILVLFSQVFKFGLMLVQVHGLIKVEMVEIRHWQQVLYSLPRLLMDFQLLMLQELSIGIFI